MGETQNPNASVGAKTAQAAHPAAEKGTAADTGKTGRNYQAIDNQTAFYDLMRFAKKEQLKAVFDDVKAKIELALSSGIPKAEDAVWEKWIDAVSKTGNQSFLHRQLAVGVLSFFDRWFQLAKEAGSGLPACGEVLNYQGRRITVISIDKDLCKSATCSATSL